MAKRQYRKKETASTAEPEADASSQTTTLVSELLQQRKQRQRPQGLASDDLIKPSSTTQTSNQEKSTPGLKLNDGLASFNRESTAMDTEKIMNEFIEKELQKRVQSTNSTATSDVVSPNEIKSEEKVFDIHEELFSIPENLQVKSQKLNEGNVTLSATMLTAIPEVDLGLAARLRNIEETEKAKQKLMQQRLNKKSEAEKLWEPEKYASERFSIAKRFDKDNGSEFINENKSSKHVDRRNLATDDVVMERFKKRMRR